MTLRELCDQYIFQNKPGASTTSEIHCFIRKYGNLGITNITPSLIGDLIQEGLKIKKPSTLVREISVLKRVFNWGMDWGLIQSNPISRVSLPKGATKRVRWITLYEEAGLLLASPAWLQNIILFALDSGLRRSEILGLTWENVNMEKKYITVIKSKNGQLRSVPMTEKVFDILSHFPYRSGNVFVFEGAPISVNQLEYEFQKAIKKADIKDLHFHDLRHTCATRMVQRGVDLYSVSVILGHTSMEMTRRYSHHNVDSLRSAIATLEKENGS